MGRLCPWPVLLGIAVVLAAAVGARRHWRTPTVLGLLLVFVAVGATAILRHQQVAASPVAELAAERALVVLELRATSDARSVTGPRGDGVLLRAEAVRVSGPDGVLALASPVLVLTDEPRWLSVPLGATVRTSARLSPAEEPGVSALVDARGPPEWVAPPDIWWRAAAAVRGSVRASVAHRPPRQAALVPALVDGDDSGVDDDLAADFRATGLTHLLAVSGTNLTLVVGFVLVAARWAGVRGRGLHVVAAAGIVGFVLLARTEPSVVRAAAMGAVGLFAMGVDGRRRGARALGAAVVGLLLLDPALAVSVGFALSVVATGGIVLLGPAWRDALARWTPRWVAEAVAVPATAQLACTPLVAAVSGQVSVVAVVANLLAAPAVGPATVLGLAGGLVGLAWAPAGAVVGTGAAHAVSWIVLVARRGADLPGAAVEWGTGPVALTALAIVALVLVLGLPRLLRRPLTALVCGCLLVVVVLLRPPTPGWPPDGWLVVACDVGQGDAIVVRVGAGAALVVDAGPEPAPVDRCLDDLGVDEVPLLVLTHFHADHVDGLAGILSGRTVGRVEVTAVRDPAEGAAQVDRELAGAGLRAVPSSYAAVQRVGEATVQVLWPAPDAPPTANDASVVLLVEVQGVRILLTGDVEPPVQARLASRWPGLRADVLKVPHHGSRYQESGWLLGLGADVALVSAGPGNDYGHPAPETLDALAGGGVTVLRTDTDGDVAVLLDDGELVPASSG